MTSWVAFEAGRADAAMARTMPDWLHLKENLLTRRGDYGEGRTQLADRGWSQTLLIN
jgi:hypothetical protein